MWTFPKLSSGGDLCRALPGNACLAWYHLGHRIALDVARALHYLHSHEVGTLCSPCWSIFHDGSDIVVWLLRSTSCTPRCLPLLTH